MQTIKQEHEYVVSISFDSLRAFIRAMIEAHEFDHEYQFDIKLPDKRSSFYQAFRIPGNRETKHYTNWIYMTPQDDSVLIKTLLEIHREIEAPPALPITWNKLRSKLERTGRKLTLVDGFENTNVFAHRYIDPSKITNPNHRKVIEALIEAESD